MSQVSELLSLPGAPLAALSPDGQALEFLAGCHIPIITTFTPYRIEHPHSARVRKITGLNRQDTLYTPSGRLTCKFVRESEDAPWQQQSNFVRRSSQLGALTAFCQDMQAVALPESQQPIGQNLWFKVLSSPFARLFQEWIEQPLMGPVSKGNEAKGGLKALDALYEKEVSILASYSPAIVIMDELLTGELAHNELWRKYALKAAGKLKATMPQASLAVTCRDLSLEAAVLPFEATLLHIIEPITPENVADLGKTLRPWLQSPPENSLALLSPSEPSLYPPLIHRLTLDT